MRERERERERDRQKEGEKERRNIDKREKEKAVEWLSKSYQQGGASTVHAGISLMVLLSSV